MNHWRGWLRPLCAVSVLLLESCGGGGGAGTAGAVAARAYALMDAGDPAAVHAAYAAMPGVDGLAVRTSWSAMAPKPGGYDWAALDAAAAAAAANGKKVGLHVVASGYATAPPWLVAQGMQTYRATSPAGAAAVEPVPWDPVFLSEWSTFVSALASHLADSGTLKQLDYLSVAVPVPEMSLPGCANGMLGGTVAYDRGKYLQAWKSAIGALHLNFPAVPKLLPAPVATVCRPDADGPPFYLELLDFALGVEPRGFALYATDLTDAGSARLDGVASALDRAPVALQFNAPMGARLRDAVCSGRRAYGATLFEAYKADLSSADAAVQAGIAAIRAGCS